MRRTLARSRWGILLVGFLLAIPYVPHEFIRSGPSTAPGVFVLVILSARRYGVLGWRVSRVEKWAVSLAIFIAFRTLLFWSFDEASFVSSFNLIVRQIGLLSAGILIYRLARHPNLRRSLITGITVGLGAAILAGAWQWAIGLERLLVLGYTSPEFNYATAAGTYRPFGTFYGATTFGAFLAVAGLTVSLSSRSTVLRYTVLGGTAAVLLLNQSRAAWLALALGLLTTLLSRNQRARNAAIRLILPVILIAGLAAIANPTIASKSVERLATIGDSSFESNESRRELWMGVLRVAPSNLIGHGAASFADELEPEIGPISNLGHAHNNFLEVLYLYGIPGLFIFSGLLMAMLKTVRQSAVSGSNPYTSAAYAGLTAFIFQGFFENTFTSLHLMGAVFLCAGLGSSVAPINNGKTLKGSKEYVQCRHATRLAGGVRGWRSHTTSMYTRERL